MPFAHGTASPPVTRQQLFKKREPFDFAECPFANLPESRGGRWGAELTAAKMFALQDKPPKNVSRQA